MKLIFSFTDHEQLKYDSIVAIDINVIANLMEMGKLRWTANSHFAFVSKRTFNLTFLKKKQIINEVTRTEK